MATIVIQPEDGEDADGDRTRGNGDDGHSKGDDTAVLQALYDGTSLSSAFHHDLAEGMIVAQIVELTCLHASCKEWS